MGSFKQILRDVIIQNGESFSIAESESQYLCSLYSKINDKEEYISQMHNAYLSYLLEPKLKLSDRVYVVKGMGLGEYFLDILKKYYIFADSVLTIEEKCRYVDFLFEGSIESGMLNVSTNDKHLYKKGIELYEKLYFDENYIKKKK